MKHARTLSVLALIALVLFASFVPASDLSWMRSDWRWFGRTMNWIEAIPGPFDMTHVLLYAALGLVAMAVHPRADARAALRVLGLVLALAAFTELAQMLAPGRRGTWPDFRDDGVGAVAGVALGWMLRVLARRGSRPVLASPSVSPLRDWMGALLAGGVPALPVASTDAADALVAAARHERVVCAVHQRLVDLGTTYPATLHAALAPIARAEAVRSLLLDSEARRIAQALADAGIDALWLKGTALAAWCYPAPHLRDRADLDVLFASHAEAMRAAEVMAPLGYALPIRHIAGDLYVYELMAWSEARRIELDLHWAIANTALFAQRLPWAELQAESEALPALGPHARRLGAVHALLHAALHRACNQLSQHADSLHWLLDVHLLAGRFTDRDWDRAVTVSIERRLADVLLQALRASRQAFATPLPPKQVDRLESAAAREPLQCARLSRWTYFQWHALRELPTRRLKSRWLRQMLIGDSAHLRERYGQDGAGEVRLVVRRILDGMRRSSRYAAMTSLRPELDR